MVLKLSWLALVAVVASACIRSAPPVRLSAPTPIVVAYTFDGDVPAELREKVAMALRERNFVPEILDLDFGIAKDTPARLARVQGAANGAPFLLVELAAEFYSQLNGRVKWNVYSKLSLQGPAGVVRTSEEKLTAMLDLPHHDGEDALSIAADLIVGQLSDELDRALAAASPT